VSVLLHEDDKLVVGYGREGRVICVAGLHAGTVVPAYRRLVVEQASMDVVRHHAEASAAADA
jgi:hypothetical protein